MKRKVPLKRNTPLKRNATISIKRKKPVAKESARRIRERPMYKAQTEKNLSGEPECQAMLEGCTFIATQQHHTQGRGIYYLAQERLMLVCGNCHDKIGADFKMALENGFILRRNTPVLRNSFGGTIHSSEESQDEKTA